MQQSSLVLGMHLTITFAAAQAGTSQEQDWNSRERESLEEVVYPQISNPRDLTSVKASFEKALAGDASAVPELSTLVGHTDSYVAMAAARALGRFPSSSSGALLKDTLRSESRGLVRGGALVGLARMRDPEAGSLARAALDDTNPTVVGAAVGALEELGDSANSLPLLRLYDKHPEETEVLKVAGALGDPPGSTAVRDKLVAEAFKTSNELETRMAAAFGLRAMGREDLAQPLFDWDSTLVTYKSLRSLEHVLSSLATQRGLAIKSQAEAERLLQDALARDADFARLEGTDGWGHANRIQFVSDGQVRAVSNGPDGTSGTPDDITLTERIEAYKERVFPDLF
jgi:HEAT repeat protein